MIIFLGKNVHGGKILFYDGVNMNNIGKRAYVLKHSHGMCVVGAPDKISMNALFVLETELALFPVQIEHS